MAAHPKVQTPSLLSNEQHPYGSEGQAVNILNTFSPYSLQFRQGQQVPPNLQTHSKLAGPRWLESCSQTPF